MTLINSIPGGFLSEKKKKKSNPQRGSIFHSLINSIRCGFATNVDSPQKAREASFKAAEAVELLQGRGSHGLGPEGAYMGARFETGIDSQNFKAAPKRVPSQKTSKAPMCHDSETSMCLVRNLGPDLKKIPTKSFKESETSPASNFARSPVFHGTTSAERTLGSPLGCWSLGWG